MSDVAVQTLSNGDAEALAFLQGAGAESFEMNGLDFDRLTGNASDEDKADHAFMAIERVLEEPVQGEHVVEINDGTVVITGESQATGGTFEFEISVSAGENSDPVMSITGSRTSADGLTENDIFLPVEIVGEEKINSVVLDMNQTFNSNDKIMAVYPHESFNVGVNFDTFMFEQVLDGAERVVTREYKDGTVVETVSIVNHIGDSQEAVEVRVLHTNGDVSTYLKIEGDDGDEWVNQETSEVGLEAGSMNDTNSEFVLEWKDFADVHYAFEPIPLTDNPDDDAAVDQVVETDPPEAHEPYIDTQNDFDAYAITLDDGLEFTVMVHRQDSQDSKPPSREGMSKSETVANEYAEILATLPPEIRELYTGIPNYIKNRTGMGAVTGYGTDHKSLTVKLGTVRNTNMNNSHNIHSIMIHEAGHVIDDLDGQGEWLDAANADTADPSRYAGVSLAEDYAETFYIWFMVRTGRVEEPEPFETAFENRFAVLDDTPAALELLPE